MECAHWLSNFILSQVGYLRLPQISTELALTVLAVEVKLIRSTQDTHSPYKEHAHWFAT